MALHEATHAPTFAVNLSGRPNQYDLWPGFPDRARVGDNLVLAVDDADAPHPAVVALAPYFGRVRQGERVALRRGEGEGEVGVRRLWVLIGWKGGWPLRVSALTASPQRVQ